MFLFIDLRVPGASRVLALAQSVHSLGICKQGWLDFFDQGEVLLKCFAHVPISLAGDGTISASTCNLKVPVITWVGSSSRAKWTGIGFVLS